MKTIEIVGILVELHERFLMLDGGTSITLPPGLRINRTLIGKRVIITVQGEGRRWEVQRVDRHPIG